VFAGINMLYMDRVLLAVINLLVIASAAISPGPWWLRTGIVAGVAALSFVAHKLLESVRDTSISPHPRLQAMAKKIARLMKVPFVVFGHTHIPVMGERTRRRIAAPDRREPGHARALVLQHGSWTSTSERGLTHVCILVDDDSRKRSSPLVPGLENRPLK